MTSSGALPGRMRRTQAACSRPGVRQFRICHLRNLTIDLATGTCRATASSLDRRASQPADSPESRVTSSRRQSLASRVQPVRSVMPNYGFRAGSSRILVQSDHASDELLPTFEPSGKIPAEWHHRKIVIRPRAERSAAGFFFSQMIVSGGKSTTPYSRRPPRGSDGRGLPARANTVRCSLARVKDQIRHQCFGSDHVQGSQHDCEGYGCPDIAGMENG